MSTRLTIAALMVLRRRLSSSGPPSPGIDNFEAELVARLKADPEIAPLVEGRVYPLAIPEKARTDANGTRKTLPAIVYAITANDRERNLQGPAGIATATVLFDARSALYSDVKLIQEALRRFDGFMGILAEDVIVLFTWFTDQGDQFEWPDAGGKPPTFHLTLGFKFKYREPSAAL